MGKLISFVVGPALPYVAGVIAVALVGLYLRGNWLAHRLEVMTGERDAARQTAAQYKSDRDLALRANGELKGSLDHLAAQVDDYLKASAAAHQASQEAVARAQEQAKATLAVAARLEALARRPAATPGTDAECVALRQVIDTDRGQP